MPNLSSPNRIIHDYFDSLRRLVEEARTALTPDHRRQSAALAVVMSVTAVEVFLNVWFRVRVEQYGSDADKQSLCKDLAQPRPASLEKKLREWPKHYLKRELLLTEGVGAEFLKLKDLRNSIIHFTSSHTTFAREGLTIHGLVDTTDYDNLAHEQAERAMVAAENYVTVVFRCAGMEEPNLRLALHLWIGRVALDS